MLGPLASRCTPWFYIAIHQVSLLSHAACTSMSTTTTTTTRDRGDRYGPIEWAQSATGWLDNQSINHGVMPEFWHRRQLQHRSRYVCAQFWWGPVVCILSIVLTNQEMSIADDPLLFCLPLCQSKTRILAILDNQLIANSNCVLVGSSD